LKLEGERLKINLMQNNPSKTLESKLGVIKPESKRMEMSLVLENWVWCQ